MEFDDQAELHEEEEDEDEGEEDEEEEEEYTDDMGRLAPTAPSYNLVGINNNNGSPSSSAPPLDSNTKAVEAAATTTRSKYRECLKNHAVGIGGHALDGCGEFLPSGPDGSIDALKCAACSCHRNFHRRENGDSALAASAQFFHHHAALPPPRPPHLLHHLSPPARPQFATYYRSSAASATVGGYHRPPPPLALPSTGSDHEAEGASNPSGGGGRKRFRTKFTGEQRERMLELAERVGWRIQKQDEALVEQFCEETGLKRQVLKVWMHNHKHTHGPIIPNKTLPPN